jgi:hypothetical protein
MMKQTKAYSLSKNPSIDVAVDRAEKIAQLCRMGVLSQEEAQSMLSDIREGLGWPRENADLKWPKKEQPDGSTIGSPDNAND